MSGILHAQSQKPQSSAIIADEVSNQVPRFWYGTKSMSFRKTLQYGTEGTPIVQPPNGLFSLFEHDRSVSIYRILTITTPACTMTVMINNVAIRLMFCAFLVSTFPPNKIRNHCNVSIGVCNRVVAVMVQ